MLDPRLKKQMSKRKSVNAKFCNYPGLDYVYTAPSDMLDSQPGTLMLTDCIETCRANTTCKSINYETGLCVLFSSSAEENAGQLTPSQFPVFTIYVQKNCLPSADLCDAAWSFERVMNHQLDTPVTHFFNLKNITYFKDSLRQK